MALEEQIIEWSVKRPAWQQFVLRKVATGAPLSDKELDQLVEDVIAPAAAEKVTFGQEHLPKSAAQDPAVRLVSIAKLEHVNALASDLPLTFQPNGLTIVYGDNGSGKSGYARLLKRITRARHQEDVLVASPVADQYLRSQDEHRDQFSGHRSTRANWRYGFQAGPLNVVRGANH